MKPPRPRRGDAFGVSCVPGLARGVRRARLVRAALPAALAAILAAAAFTASRGPETATAAAPPSGPNLVVALDVSASLAGQQSHAIAAHLRRAATAAADSGAGLVLFSDSALLALPPGTPARELARVADHVTRRPSSMPVQIPDAAVAAMTPGGWGLPAAWDAFSAGTRIATGLRRAREVLAPLGGGEVLLVSDLYDAPDDRRALDRELAAYAADPRLELRLAPVAALPSDLERFERAGATVGRPAVPEGSSTTASSHATAATTVALVVLAAAAALALGAHELLAVPVRRRREVSA